MKLRVKPGITIVHPFSGHARHAFVVVATCCENITTVDLNDDTQYLNEDDDGVIDEREEAKRESLGTGDMGAVIRARDDTFCNAAAFSLHSLLYQYHSLALS